MSQQIVKQKDSDFEEVLRKRGVKLERGRKVIDRLLDSNSGKIIKNNPEKKFRKESPLLNSLEHYSESEYSIESQKMQFPARALPRTPSKNFSSNMQQGCQLLHMSRDAILAEKARKFVNRLRKQKQYEDGKAIMRRKKEEELRIRKQRAEKNKKQKQKSFFKSERYKQMMANIVTHEEKISYRLRNSMNRQKTSGYRSLTRASEDLESKPISKSAMFDYQSQKKSSRVCELPRLASLKERLAVLSNLVNSLQF